MLFAAVVGNAANSAVTVGLLGSGDRGTYVAGLCSELLIFASGILRRSSLAALSYNHKL
jgi:hypothetical protein